MFVTPNHYSFLPLGWLGQGVLPRGYCYRWAICLSVRLSVRLSVCLSVCLSVSLSTFLDNMIARVLIKLWSSNPHKPCFWTCSRPDFKMGQDDLVLRSTWSETSLWLAFLINIFCSSGPRNAKISQNMHIGANFWFVRKKSHDDLILRSPRSKLSLGLCAIASLALLM